MKIDKIINVFFLSSCSSHRDSALVDIFITFLPPAVSQTQRSKNKFCYYYDSKLKIDKIINVFLSSCSSHRDSALVDIFITFLPPAVSQTQRSKNKFCYYYDSKLKIDKIINVFLSSCSSHRDSALVDIFITFLPPAVSQTQRSKNKFCYYYDSKLKIDKIINVFLSGCSSHRDSALVDIFIAFLPPAVSQTQRSKNKFCYYYDSKLKIDKIINVFLSGCSSHRDSALVDIFITFLPPAVSQTQRSKNKFCYYYDSKLKIDKIINVFFLSSCSSHRDSALVDIFITFLPPAVSQTQRSKNKFCYYYDSKLKIDKIINVFLSGCSSHRDSALVDIFIAFLPPAVSQTQRSKNKFCYYYDSKLKIDKIINVFLSGCSSHRDSALVDIFITFLPPAVSQTQRNKNKFCYYYDSKLKIDKIINVFLSGCSSHRDSALVDIFITLSDSAQQEINFNNNYDSILKAIRSPSNLSEPNKNGEYGLLFRSLPPLLITKYSLIKFLKPFLSHSNAQKGADFQ